MAAEMTIYVLVVRMIIMKCSLLAFISSIESTRSIALKSFIGHGPLDNKLPVISE